MRSTMTASRTRCIGGAALRPAHFLPIGINGSTEEIAQADRLPRGPRQGEGAAGEGRLADGFEFEIAYGNAAIAGVSYQVLAQKIQADLAPRRHQGAARARWTRSTCAPSITGGKSQGGVLTFWNPPAVENLLWALATVERVAKRVHWTPPRTS